MSETLSEYSIEIEYEPKGRGGENRTPDTPPPAARNTTLLLPVVEILYHHLYFQQNYSNNIPSSAPVK